MGERGPSPHEIDEANVKPQDSNAETTGDAAAHKQEAHDTTPDNMKQRGTFFTRNEAGHKIQSIEKARAEMERDLNSRDTTPDNMKARGTFFTRNEAGHKIQSIEKARAEMNMDLNNKELSQDSETPVENSETNAARANVNINDTIRSFREAGGNERSILPAEMRAKINEFAKMSKEDKANLPDEEWNKIMQLKQEAADKLNQWLTENKKPEDSTAEAGTAETEEASAAGADSEVPEAITQVEAGSDSEADDAVPAEEDLSDIDIELQGPMIERTKAQAKGAERGRNARDAVKKLGARVGGRMAKLGAIIQRMGESALGSVPGNKQELNDAIFNAERAGNEALGALDARLESLADGALDRAGKLIKQGRERRDQIVAGIKGEHANNVAAALIARAEALDRRVAKDEQDIGNHEDKITDLLSCREERVNSAIMARREARDMMVQIEQNNNALAGRQAERAAKTTPEQAEAVPGETQETADRPAEAPEAEQVQAEQEIGQPEAPSTESAEADILDQTAEQVEASQTETELGQADISEQAPENAERTPSQLKGRERAAWITERLRGVTKTLMRTGESLLGADVALRQSIDKARQTAGEKLDEISTKIDDRIKASIERDRAKRDEKLTKIQNRDLLKEANARLTEASRHDRIINSHNKEIQFHQQRMLEIRMCANDRREQAQALRERAQAVLDDANVNNVPAEGEVPAATKAA